MEFEVPLLNPFKKPDAWAYCPLGDETAAGPAVSGVAAAAVGGAAVGAVVDAAAADAAAKKKEKKRKPQFSPNPNEDPTLSQEEKDDSPTGAALAIVPPPPPPEGLLSLTEGKTQYMKFFKQVNKQAKTSPSAKSGKKK